MKPFTWKDLLDLLGGIILYHHFQQTLQ